MEGHLLTPPSPGYIDKSIGASSSVKCSGKGVIESVRSSLTVLETFEPTDVSVVKATLTLISPLTLIPVLTP